MGNYYGKRETDKKLFTLGPNQWAAAGPIRGHGQARARAIRGQGPGWLFYLPQILPSPQILP